MKTWPRVPLGDLCAERTGTKDPTKFGDRKFLYVDIGSVDVTRKLVTGARWLAGCEAPSRARKRIIEGDVIVSMTRPNLNAVAYISPDLSEQVCSTGFAVLRPGPNLDAGFLFHFVQTPRFANELSALTAGALYPAVSEGQVREQAIPLPPLAEQRRIVDILDRAAGIRRLRRQAQDTARLIIPALFNKMFGDPATNPKSLPVRPLRDLVRFVSGATPSKAVPSFWTGQLPWVSAKDLKADPIVTSQDHISEQGRTSARLHVIPAGINLVLVRGMTLIHTVPIRITAVPVTINQDVKALLPREPMEGSWLRWALQSMHATLLSNVSSAAHGTRKLDLDQLGAIQIALPSIEQQRDFCRQLARVNGFLKRQELALDTAATVAQALQSRLLD